MTVYTGRLIYRETLTNSKTININENIFLSNKLHFLSLLFLSVYSTSKYIFFILA